MNNHKRNIAKNPAIKSSPLSSHSGHFLCALCLLICLAFFSHQLRANGQPSAYSSRSYEAFSQEISDAMRATILSQSSGALSSDQQAGKATAASRNELQAVTQPRSRSYAPEFTIYDAFATLQDDYDGDGYYQTVTVVFDADIYSYDGNDLGEVYARLYLSENGGPWFHYYTTNNFLIHGDSEQDAYEVISNFSQGYYPGHYDILIDLYQVGYAGIVATYSSADNQALYALPLESSDYDPLYVDSVSIHHGGSLSALALMLLVLLLTARLTVLNMRS